MKYLKLYKLALFIMFFFIKENISAQKKVCDLNISGYSERIDLNTDRDLYINGEMLFFSASYFINNIQTKPILSKVMYIELINCSDNFPVIQKKISILNFNANGSIQIPENIVSGNYMLRAYTQYQKNFSAYDFAYHFITILNPTIVKTPIIENELNEQIEIIYTNNILDDNEKSPVVIKIPNYLINHENTYSIIYSNGENQNFQVTKDGFPQKDFFINNNKQYKLKILTNSGDTILKEFPKVKTIGFSTNIRKIKNNIIYKVKPIGLNTKDEKYKIYVVSNNYNVKYTKEININDNQNSIVLDKNFFNLGINYIILLNNKGKIEKINSIFISNTKKDRINIELPKNTFKVKDDVSVSFSLTDFNIDESVYASVSVSMLGTKKYDNRFFSNLYFSNPIVLQEYLLGLPEKNELFENQIMTLFNDKIDKKELKERLVEKTKTSLKYIPEINSLTIHGIVKDKITNKPVSDQEVFLSVIFNNSQVHTCKTKNDGSFIFNINNVVDINDVFICLNPTYKKDVEIIINNSFSSIIPKIGNVPTFISESNKDLINKMYRNSQILNYIQKPETKLNHKREKTGNFNISYNKKTTYVKNFITLKSFEEFIFEVVPFLQYKKGNDGYDFNIFNEKGFILPGKPLVLLDNIPIFDFSKMSKIKLSDVEKIEVINKKYYLGSSTFQGVVMVTTKTNNFAGVAPPKSGVFFEFQAIDNKKGDSFSTNFSNHEGMPDFRTLLYWNPNIKLKKQKENLTFKTSFSKGTYKINIKAHNSKGEIYYGSKQFTIE